MQFKAWLIFLVLGLAGISVLGLTPTDLMCELLAKPGFVTVTDATPEFSWCFKDARQGDFQRAFQIQVASKTEFFKTDKPDLWDSGLVLSSQSINLAYAGKPLPTKAEVFWRMRVWDCKLKISAWSIVMAFKTADQMGEDRALQYPLTQISEIPVRVITNSARRVFVDFGQAAFGWVELLTPRDMEKGGPFTLHIGEKAISNQVDTAPGGSIRYAKVVGALTRPRVYRVPFLADKRNTGSDAIQLPPELGVVMPFRYVEVQECPFTVTRENIRRVAVYYPFDMHASAFVSSDDVLNRVYAFCKHSIKATTFAGVYVDGDRERIPYEADAYINQLCHYALDREFTLARYSHEYLMSHPTWPTEWKQHSVMMAWTDWMYTGNIESLARCYEKLKTDKTLEFAAREPDGLLVTSGTNALISRGLKDITDWPAGERDGFEFKPVNAVVNAFYCLNLRQMAEIAKALGKEADAVAYLAKAERATAAFNKLFFNAERGCYLDGEGATNTSLHASMLPLAFGLVPEEIRSRVAAFVKSRGMACSVYGAQYLLEALFESGMEDEAIKLMMRNDPRGWVNMMRAGSTITMEAWDVKYKPNQDWNHAWGAAPANILPRYVLGVRPLAPGFGRMLIRPQAGSLEAVQGIVPTIRGAVEVGVRQKKGVYYRVTIKIPVNTTARLELPIFPEVGALRVNGKKVDRISEGGRLVLNPLVSGIHTVTWQAEEGPWVLNCIQAMRETVGSGWRQWMPFF